MNRQILALIAAAALGCGAMQAQAPIEEILAKSNLARQAEAATADTIVVYESVCDSLLAAYADSPAAAPAEPFPAYFFLPAVYDTFRQLDTPGVETPIYSGVDEMRWIEGKTAQANRMKSMLQYFFVASPRDARYNINLLPEAPKKFQAEVNLENHTIEIKEIPALQAPTESTLQVGEIKKRHWIRTFNTSLQFSQAFVSPNWYQGGTNNLNALGQIYYNVKLNQSYHPTLLFESTFQYKLGMTNAPDDKVHNYSISEDLFQINSTFGIKAVEHWYYSLTGQFKTQMLNSYTPNSMTLRSAFLSPADLNVGLGMTYNLAKPKVTLDASIAPISYNMVICINDGLDPTNYGIEAGHKFSHKFGSTAEVKFKWQISYNITYNTRVFGFTDYHRAYADWENTLAFEINRFLTTQINVNMRYDTATPPVADTEWKKLQLKEILSIGFAYKFSSI